VESPRLFAVAPDGGGRARLRGRRALPSARNDRRRPQEREDRRPRGHDFPPHQSTAGSVHNYFWKAPRSEGPPVNRTSPAAACGSSCSRWPSRTSRRRRARSAVPARGLKAIYAVLRASASRCQARTPPGDPVLRSAERGAPRVRRKCQLQNPLAGHEAGVIAVSVGPEHVARVRALRRPPAPRASIRRWRRSEGRAADPCPTSCARWAVRERSTFARRRRAPLFRRGSRRPRRHRGADGRPAGSPFPSAPTRKARRARSRSAC